MSKSDQKSIEFRRKHAIDFGLVRSSGKTNHIASQITPKSLQNRRKWRQNRDLGRLGRVSGVLERLEASRLVSSIRLAASRGILGVLGRPKANHSFLGRAEGFHPSSTGESTLETPPHVSGCLGFSRFLSGCLGCRRKKAFQVFGGLQVF